MGACGSVASRLLEDFRTRYDLLLVDVVTTNSDGMEVAGVQVADLTDMDHANYARLFDGVDTLLHLGYTKSPDSISDELDPIDQFDHEFNHIRMSSNVFRGAFEAGVRRVVMASSDEATKWPESLSAHSYDASNVYPEGIQIAENFSGWASTTIELIGVPYASGVYGRKLEVVIVRLGVVLDASGGDSAEAQSTEGSRAGGIARDGGHGSGGNPGNVDLRQVMRRAIDTPDITRPDGVPWQIVSANPEGSLPAWSFEIARSAPDPAQSGTQEGSE